MIAGAGMAIGPWAGDLLPDHVGWRWIFFVNVPPGAAVLVAVGLAVRLPASTRRRAVDHLGGLLAAASSAALLLALDWGGEGSPAVVGLVVGAALTLGLFLWRQATASEPVLPLSLFRSRPVRLAFAVQLLVGIVLSGLVVYVLVYLQVARGVGASSAGFELLPLAAGMGVSGIAAGKIAGPALNRRRCALVGTAVCAAALFLLGLSGAATDLWLVRAELLLAGLGLGLLVGQLIQYAQEQAPQNQVGVTTTGVRLFQTLGNAAGATLFGSLLSRWYAAHGPGGVAGDVPRLTGTARAQGLDALVDGVDTVFWVAAAVMVVAVVVSWRLPRPAAAQAGARQTAGVVGGRSRAPRGSRGEAHSRDGLRATGAGAYRPGDRDEIDIAHTLVHRHAALRAGAARSRAHGLTAGALTAPGMMAGMPIPQRRRLPTTSLTRPTWTTRWATGSAGIRRSTAGRNRRGSRAETVRVPFRPHRLPGSLHRRLSNPPVMAGARAVPRSLGAPWWPAGFGRRGSRPVPPRQRWCPRAGRRQTWCP